MKENMPGPFEFIAHYYGGMMAREVIMTRSTIGMYRFGTGEVAFLSKWNKKIDLHVEDLIEQQFDRVWPKFSRAFYVVASWLESTDDANRAWYNMVSVQIVRGIILLLLSPFIVPFLFFLMREDEIRADWKEQEKEKLDSIQNYAAAMIVERERRKLTFDFTFQVKKFKKEFSVPIWYNTYQVLVAGQLVTVPETYLTTRVDKKFAPYLKEIK